MMCNTTREEFDRLTWGTGLEYGIPQSWRDEEWSNWQKSQVPLVDWLIDRRAQVEADVSYARKLVTK